jgi:hypothetical protein
MATLIKCDKCGKLSDDKTISGGIRRTWQIKEYKRVLGAIQLSGDYCRDCVRALVHDSSLEEPNDYEN